jgi:hypothetical protein
LLCFPCPSAEVDEEPRGHRQPGWPGVVRSVGAVAMVRSNATITYLALRQAAFYIDS